MNLRDLQYLVAVADHLHFGRAATACFVSQPTLSAQIRKLEAELGVELFERHPRQVLLTEVGAEIVEQARHVLVGADELTEIARRARDPESGTMRLGIFPTLGPYLLPHVLSAVRERFPRMELLLVEEKTPEVVRRLLAGQLDAAVLALPLGDELLVVDPLFEEPFELAVPAGHPLAVTGGGDGARVPPAVLADEAVLLLEDGHCLRDQALSVCRLAGADERQGFRASSLETLRQMVGMGAGVTLMPVLAVSPPIPPSERISLRRFTDPVPSRRIALVWRRGSALRRILPELAAVIRGALPDGVTPLGPDD